jgi:hypothetical protein
VIEQYPVLTDIADEKHASHARLFVVMVEASANVVPVDVVVWDTLVSVTGSVPPELTTIRGTVATTELITFTTS